LQRKIVDTVTPLLIMGIANYPVSVLTLSTARTAKLALSSLILILFILAQMKIILCNFIFIFNANEGKPLLKK
jgi:hypothetical protein